MVISLSKAKRIGILLLFFIALLVLMKMDSAQEPLEKPFDRHLTPQVIWPVDKEYGDAAITSPFGFRYDPFTGAWIFHQGIDIGLPYGESVYSISDGIVIAVSTDCPGFGTLLIIEHHDLGNGVCVRSVYGHCHQIFVEEGDKVTIGQMVAAIGSRGRSTGPHLHLEVHVFCREEEEWNPVDPLEYFDLSGD